MLSILAFVLVASSSEEVSFKSSDGIAVKADFYEAKSSKKVILLFHQMGSNAGEYDDIAPRLVGMGWDCVAADMRGGGNMWGKRNRTSQASLPFADRYKYAHLDMNATVEWAEKKGYKTIVVWGSSYAAGLVFNLAKDYKSVDAVLSFSPPALGRFSGQVTSGIDVPIFATVPPNEIGSRSSLEKKWSFSKVTYFKQKAGVHGSSTLLKSRNSAGWEQNWKPVVTFLEGIG